MHAIGCIACCACLSAGGLGDLEERGVGAHVADLEAREVDAVDVGLGHAQVVLRDAAEPEIEVTFVQACRDLICTHCSNC